MFIEQLDADDAMLIGIASESNHFAAVESFPAKRKPVRHLNLEERVRRGRLRRGSNRHLLCPIFLVATR
jgi:hypothetical protein